MGSSIKRNSSVELLKVIAIFLIVISHTTQSVGATSNSLLGDLVSAVSYKTASRDMNAVVLMVFRHFGAIGNVIFMVCSSWFLIDEKKTDYRKVYRMIIEVWAVSVLILLLSHLGGVHIGLSIVRKSLLPTFSNNNWYITCYMLIYSAHGLFNVLIESMSKKVHGTLCLVMAILYLLLTTVKNDAFFNTNLMVFSTIYFVVAYIKKYRTDYVYNRGMNRTVLLSCSILLVGSIVFINYAGLRVGILSSKVLALAKTCNPLIVGMALSGFHLSISRSFFSKIINYVSSLSLLIYLIHENIILRMLRPAIWELFTVNLNGLNVAIRTLVLAAFIWLFAFAMASIYKLFIEKHINHVADRVYSFVDSHVCKLLNQFCGEDK